MIRRIERHLASFYVINDPSNGENNGQVKILRFGKRIYEKILAATEGDDAKEFGARIFDLSENGCSFRIKVESTVEGKRKFTNYSNSRFTSPCAIDGLTPEKIKGIYEGIFDLKKHIDTKNQSELEKMLKVHLFCEGTDSKFEFSPADESDNIPGLGNDVKKELQQAVELVAEEVEKVQTPTPVSAPVSTPEIPKIAETASEASTEKSRKMKELLDSLDNV